MSHPPKSTIRAPCPRCVSLSTVFLVVMAGAGRKWARIIALSGAGANGVCPVGPSGSTIHVTDEIENIVLEQLRLLRNEIQTMRRQMGDGFSDLAFRINNLERLHLVYQTEMIRHSEKFDQLDEKIRQ